MAIFDLFSKRGRRARGELPDVYQYESLPPAFRVQVVHILRDLFGSPEYDGSQTEDVFKAIHGILCREYGQFVLSDRFEGRGQWRAAVFEFLMKTDTEKALDVIEVAFRIGEGLAGDQGFQWHSKPTVTVKDAIVELNERFRYHGIGFQFESSAIIRVDSQTLHAESVRPALQLLSDKRFAGANAEFLKAHEHYRHGRNAECMNECLKALESTLKIICGKQGWSFRETDTAKTLIDVVFTNGLVPHWLQSEFTALRSTLESGVPTARNRLAGHGQGGSTRQIPGHMAAYLLHLTASAILLLVEAERNQDP